jgi:hypothetical protein
MAPMRNFVAPNGKYVGPFKLPSGPDIWVLEFWNGRTMQLSFKMVRSREFIMRRIIFLFHGEKLEIHHNHRALHGRLVINSVFVVT